MISVCIATYNGEKFIRRQLDSIICQLSPGDEIIVSDDGSTDGTVRAVERLRDERMRMSGGAEEAPGVAIRIINGQGRRGPTLNFERALGEAAGDYIFLSDQDDVWLPGKVGTCLRWLGRYGCVVHDAEMADERLNVTCESYYKVHGTRRPRLWNLLVKNGYMGCCMAFTRRVLDASLPFPAGIPMHDIWIGNVAAYRYSLKFIPDRLTLFRCHGGNASFTARVKSGNSLLKMLLIRWKTAVNLIKLNVR